MQLFGIRVFEDQNISRSPGKAPYRTSVYGL